MINFDVLNRFTGAVQFTAEIDCIDGESRSIKLGLAVNWAVKNRASLTGANLAGASLYRANLDGANLTGASLAGANLDGASGINDWIKCIHIEDWPITYTSDTMQIGCQRHPLEAWRNFSDAEIRAMDGRKALAFWTKWKSWIFQTIEMAPALPMKSSGVEK